MRIAVFVATLVASTCLASDPPSYCSDPALNRAWREALVQHPNDALIARLAAERESVCTRREGPMVAERNPLPLRKHWIEDESYGRARPRRSNPLVLPVLSTF